MTHNSPPAVPPAANTALPFFITDYDTDGFYDFAASPSRLTVPAGFTRVRLAASIRWQSNVNGIREIVFRKNGALFVGSANSIHTAAGGAIAQNISSAVVSVVAGDYFEVYAWQNSGGNLGMDAVSPVYSHSIQAFP